MGLWSNNGHICHIIFSLIFSFGFWRSFNGIYTYIFPHIFPTWFLGELIISLISRLGFDQGGVLSLNGWSHPLFKQVKTKLFPPWLSTNPRSSLEREKVATTSTHARRGSLSGKYMKFEQHLYTINTPLMINERTDYSPLHLLFIVFFTFTHTQQRTSSSELYV